MNTIQFGKYKGKKYSEIPEDYIQFLIDRNRETTHFLQAELDRRRNHQEKPLPLFSKDGPLPQITMIISGGQTGVDQAALVAANACGIETGGYAPMGYMTEDGPADWLMGYGLEEGGKYRDSYGNNLPLADGLVLFGVMDPSIKRMSSLCQMENKPYKHVYWKGPHSINDDPWSLLDWTRQHYIQKLWVAGNKESKNPGIGEAVLAFMMEFLDASKKDFKLPF